MEENKKQKVKEIVVAVAVCTAVLVGLLALSTGMYNYFYDNDGNNKAIETYSDKQIEDNNDEEMTVELIDPETIDEENNEEENEEELTEEEKQQREEQRKKQEEERKKKEEERKKLEAEGYPYWIKVNYSANTVTVYTKDADGNYTVPYKAMVCSTGRATPHSGVYRTPQKARWGVLIGPVWGQYCTRITGQILFHSVPYLKERDPSSLEYWEYDRLGTQRSMGCIRLTVADAQWIYNNCPLGTSVEFYSNPSNPGPLGKPGIQPVTAAGDPYKGWDPTDPDPNNPWRHKEEIERQKRAEEEARLAKEQADRQAQEAAKRAEEEKQAQEKARLEKEEAERKARENQVTVKSVVGRNIEEAKTILDGLGLNYTIKNSGTFDASKNENVVISQEPEGQTVDKTKTTVTLVINYKKPTEPENPNENTGEETTGGNNNPNENENSQSKENP